MSDDAPFLIFLFDPFIRRLRAEIEGDRKITIERIVKRRDRGSRRSRRNGRWLCCRRRCNFLILRLGSFHLWLTLGLCSGLHALIFFFDWLGFWGHSLGRGGSA